MDADERKGGLRRYLFPCHWASPRGRDLAVPAALCAALSMMAARPAAPVATRHLLQFRDRKGGGRWARRACVRSARRRGRSRRERRGRWRDQSERRAAAAAASAMPAGEQEIRDGLVQWGGPVAEAARAARATGATPSPRRRAWAQQQRAASGARSACAEDEMVRKSAGEGVDAGR